ncbi:RNA polymerase sigma factor [Clostridium tunisiense]|uniref:RNA polymerase sigma factor n=1 Tax=Clostridium tunisiense TaxID=219748 RepID=UPI0002F29758|nr:sigma-70 family RNA polymerase sigma factor [Clostridium tunisiense]
MEDMEQVYLSYAQTVYKYLFYLTGDEHLSEELTQETFYQASKTINDFRGECKVSVWLCQIAKYLWYKQLEKQSKVTNIQYEEALLNFPSKQNVENDILKNNDKIELFRMIHTLDVKSKEVVYLRLTGELSFAEIGDILNQSETWARVTFYRAKKNLLKGRSE